MIDEEGNILEMVIWQVTTPPSTPPGVRYRLAFVRRGEPAPAVLYDNHPPKGHHRHLCGVEGAYEFIDLDHLIADFMADVQHVTGSRRWPGP